MRSLTHGRAVSAFGRPGLAVATSFILVFGGCRSSAGDAAGPGATSRPAEQEPPLPPPRMTREVVERRAMTPPPALGELKPAAALAADQRQTFYPFAGPALARVERREGSVATVVAEAEVGRSAILLIDRRAGVVLDGRVLAAGPLSRGASYELYVLPPGGVRNEVTVTQLRPETEQERRDRGEVERRAGVTTSPFPFPTTRPTP